MPLIEYPYPTLAFFAAAVAAGGLVKGISGFGMPMVSVSLIASVTGPAQAIALVAVPNMGANIWQAVHSGRYRAMLVRLWPLLLPLFVVTYFAAQILSGIDAALASRFLGILVIAFGVVQFTKLSVNVSPRWEKFVSPVVGVTAGLVGGMSSFFGPPVTMYLIALKLPKEDFIAATAVCFLVGGTALYTNFAINGILGGLEFGASALAVVPVIGGFALGRTLSRRVPQTSFDYLILAVLMLVGLNLLRRGFA